MPNWVQNYLITDNPDIFPPLLDEEGEFDFNKLIFMPKELELEYNNNVAPVLTYYITERLTIPVEKTILENLIRSKVISMYKDCNEIVSRLKLLLNQNPSREYWEEQYELGKQLYFNYEHYGHLTWYGWSWENWGTKWNACDTSFNSDNPTEIVFNTAWCPPEPIFKKICNLYPDSKISFKCEGEDCLVTEYENRNGKLVIINEYEVAENEESS